MNLLSITTPPLAVLIGQRGFQLDAILEVMHRMRKESLVDGFEFQNLAEWDASGPPRDKAQFEVRLKVWEECEKYSVDELAVVLTKSKLPILSVHANRDVGIHLCSDQRREIQRGEKLIHDSLNLAQQVGAGLCVFHLWDTWKKHFDPGFLQRTLEYIADQYPKVKAAVENVPINLSNYTPFDVVKEFEWITLDLRWAGMYNELDKFEVIKNRIVNVHLRGRLESKKWKIYHAPFTFYEVVKKIKEGWD
ncbi:MAG: hypothetical protein ACFFDE_04715, partial [Promethearchaeota archaeon]